MTAGRTINSKSIHWCTPLKYINAVKKVFNNKISLDPCSNEWSVVRADVEYKLPNYDGLLESWDYSTIFVNPPYGLDKERKTRIKDWLKRCCFANQNHNSEVIALVPVATNTSHWKEYIWGKASSICFLEDTRLKFLINGEDTGTGAPMACAMIYWNKNIDNFTKVFNKFGAVVNIQALQNK